MIYFFSVLAIIMSVMHFKMYVGENNKRVKFPIWFYVLLAIICISPMSVLIINELIINIGMCLCVTTGIIGIILIIISWTSQDILTMDPDGNGVYVLYVTDCSIITNPIVKSNGEKYILYKPFRLLPKWITNNSITSFLKKGI